MHQAQNRRAQIRQLCKRIAHEFRPEKIMLFGSHAYGQPTPESDLDLLVVMPFEGDPLEQAAAMLNRLNVLMPVDVFVRTPEQVRHRLAMGDSFMRDILERGKVMYEAHPAAISDRAQCLLCCLSLSRELSDQKPCAERLIELCISNECDSLPSPSPCPLPHWGRGYR
jgi:predicted nucleotidyltransferase